MKNHRIISLAACSAALLFISIGRVYAEEKLDVTLVKSIQANDPEIAFERLLRTLKSNDTATVVNLKSFYQKFKKQMWQEHHAQLMWQGFITLYEHASEGQNDMIDQIIDDCVMFDYFKEPGISPFRSPAQFPENSKLRGITKWVYSHKGMDGLNAMYSNALKKSKGALALGIMLNTPDVKDDKAKQILAQKRINAYEELHKLGVHNVDLARLFLELPYKIYSDEVEKASFFRVEKYREQLEKQSENGEITKEQKLILDQLGSIDAKLAQDDD